MNKSGFLVDWKAFIIGFIFTIVSLPFINAIGPLIGGTITGYMVGGNYKNGIVNGGLSVSLASLIYAIVVDSLLKGAYAARAQST